METGVQALDANRMNKVLEALGIADFEAADVLSNGEKQTNRLIHVMATRGVIDDQEERGLISLARVAMRFRANAHVPLSETELEGLLTVIRGIYPDLDGADFAFPMAG